MIHHGAIDIADAVSVAVTDRLKKRAAERLIAREEAWWNEL
jgi:hypothetical protein